LIPQNRHLSAIDFYPGFPNLYVTSSAEILQTVLMIYSKDKEMPLPTQEEVLICNEKTTAEEVILLWRRAIFDPGHKRIFCLVHGEKLSYSTCEESLRELNRLKQGKKGYRLVLLCSNNEDSLHFITALHSYKRSNPDISGPILKEYLLHHLIKPKHTSIGTISSAIQASSVDPHCSYVRIVQSKNPGNGKSLYIQRLGERLMNSLNIEIPIIRIPIHGPDVPYNNILNKLSDLTQDDTKIIHFDIASTMLKKVESFLFYVLVLGYLKDLRGNTWRRQISQMYTIEVTLSDRQNHEATYNLLRLFPKALCLSPSNCRYINKSNACESTCRSTRSFYLWII
ncbi:PREDICTED: E3 ubiquitin-protein ligase rnf213-alpha-like, partial [Amphimedon queenslandica]|uniref:Uncharacterized protein n=1 Tax=Amphimedon queenslandica TaxID=400682 RepID=A0AAN0K272_AMPQE